MRLSAAIRAIAALSLGLTLSASIGGTALATALDPGSRSVTATHKPDASIKALKSLYYIDYQSKWISWPVDSSWHGVGIYNTTATNQRVTADWQYGCCNEKHTFSISIRNNGNASDRFKIKATGSGLAGWAVTYFTGTANITSAVVAGTYATPLVAAGGHFLMTAKLTGSAAAQTFSGYRLVMASSFADSTKKDAVRFQLHKATWCYC